MKWNKWIKYKKFLIWFGFVSIFKRVAYKINLKIFQNYDISNLKKRNKIFNYKNLFNNKLNSVESKVPYYLFSSWSITQTRCFNRSALVIRE